MLARLIILLTVVFAALIAGAPISVAEPPGPARADHPATGAASQHRRSEVRGDALLRQRRVPDRPAAHHRGNPARRCIAHKRNGEQCRRHARRRTTVCDWHGARAPQVKAKARQRLEEAADRMERELLGIATSAESESVRLAAIRDAFDRGGLGAKAGIELSAKPKEPWQEVFDVIAAIPRHDSAVVGPPSEPPPDLASPEVVEAEVVPDPLGPPVQPAAPPVDEAVGADARDGKQEEPTASRARPVRRQRLPGTRRQRATCESGHATLHTTGARCRSETVARLRI
jgi:hypothetical protein